MIAFSLNVGNQSYIAVRLFSDIRIYCRAFGPVVIHGRMREEEKRDLLSKLIEYVK